MFQRTNQRLQRIFTNFLSKNKLISSSFFSSSSTSSSSSSSSTFNSSFQRIACSLTALGLLTYGSVRSFNTITALTEESSQKRVLYPPIEPYHTANIKVSDLHTVHYELYGNPQGKPVLFVHGGPGGGTTPKMAQFFDPKAYRIILVDQRGCGKSTPFAELKDNTTYDSIKDFEKIRQELKIEKWQIFGGSWGSTLGLAYAMEHPHRVTELVLRGIFLLRKKEIDWFYQAGADVLFPDVWEIYKSVIPVEEQKDYLKAYHRRLTGEFGPEVMKNAAIAWSVWEGKTSNLYPPPEEDIQSKHGAVDFSLAFARIENHYFTNHGFFPRDGFLLEKKQIDKIRHIPTFIVQGRYDVVCPMMSAYELHKAFPEAEFKITITGHSGFEPDIISELVTATDKFKYRYTA